MVEALFFLFSAIALGAAVNVLIQRHVLYSALSLIGMLLATSGLFILLGADMLAVIQIIVYTGAIMVLFVFVIMLLNVGPEEERTPDPHRWLKLIGLPMAIFLLGMLLSVFVEIPVVESPGVPVGTPRDIGMSLFTDYLLPFEATSVLILVAIVGALVLAKKDL